MASASNYGVDGQGEPSPALTYMPWNGCMMLATNLTWLLYGCYLIQAYKFFSHARSYPTLALPILVMIATLAGGIHVAFATGTQWGFLVEHWGHPHVWAETPWMSTVGAFTSGINGSLTQLFFVVRIWKLSKHWAARSSAVAIGITSILALGGAIAVVIGFRGLGADASKIDKLKSDVRLWSVSTVVCDVWIAFTMSRLLFSRIADTRHESMRKLLTNLVFQSIETGTVTAVNMLLYLIFYETQSSRNGLYLICVYASGPIYGNVLLYVLNSMRINAKAQRRPVRLTSPSSILHTNDLISADWTKGGPSYGQR